MKKLLFLGLAVVALAGITSCGGDDANPSNLTIDDTKVSGLVLNAYMIDDGYCCVRTEGTSNTTFTRFLLTDGEYTFDSQGEIDNHTYGDLELEIWIDVETEGNSFSTGEYELYPFCNESSIVRGANVDASWYDGENEYSYEEDGGTVTITGSGTTYTLSFDGELVDYNSGGLQRQGGCIYTSVDITGKIKRKFTPISEDVWYNWF